MHDDDQKVNEYAMGKWIPGLYVYASVQELQVLPGAKSAACSAMSLTSTPVPKVVLRFVVAACVGGFVVGAVVGAGVVVTTG